MAPRQMSGAVVVTGASSGIGEACALRLDELGYRVFAGVRRAEDADRLRGMGTARITPLIIDVADEASLRSAAHEVEKAVGAAELAGLVNNAGIVVGGPLEFIPTDELRRQLEVNAVGPIAVAQAFLPSLRAARGRIVNIGSVSGFMAFPFMGPYCASKFALRALNDSLRIELRPWGISVSLIEPGSIQTPIWRKSRVAGQEMRAMMPPEAEELYGKALEAVVSVTEKVARRADPIESVVRAVEHALGAKKPKSHYLIGKSARLQAFASKWIPSSRLDRIIAKQMKLEP